MNPVKEIVRSKIKEILRPKGHSGSIGDDDLLISSGLMDSMDVVRMVNFLEKKFGIDLSERGFRLGDFDRINDIVRLCAEFEKK